MRRALTVVSVLLVAAGPQGRPAWVEQLRELEKAYDVQVEFVRPAFPVQTTHGQITGATAKTSELAAYVPLFVEEFRRYPASLVRRTGVRRIVLCRTLAFGDDPRASIPDYDHTVMYYDAARAAYSPAYQRATVHHEFFHMVDWKDDSLVYRDAEWSRLNGPGFQYGRRHVRGIDPSLWGEMNDGLKGFLNRYSMTGVQEDKAEIFCYLIFKPEMIRRRAGGDEILARKVAVMKRLMNAFEPSMDQSYWDALASR